MRFLKKLASSAFLIQAYILTLNNASANILFAGDSDIAYWETSNMSFPRSVNVGVAGSTCDEVNSKIDQHLSTYEPDYVVLVCGENDLWDQDSTATFDDFSTIVDKIIEFGAIVIYMGTKPEPDSTDLHSDYEEYDAKIRTLATDLSATGDTVPLIMVDVYPVFGSMEDSGDLYRSDSLHLNDYGYSFWNIWAQTALDDASNEGMCVRWLNNECDELAGITEGNSVDEDSGVYSSANTLFAGASGILGAVVIILFFV